MKLTRKLQFEITEDDLLPLWQSLETIYTESDPLDIGLYPEEGSENSIFQGMLPDNGDPVVVINIGQVLRNAFIDDEVDSVDSEKIQAIRNALSELVAYLDTVQQQESG